MNTTLYRPTFLTAVLLFALPAFGGGHTQAPPKPLASDQALSAEISSVLDEYEALWDAQDPAGLIALWDQDDSEPFYLAEEQEDWRIGWDQLKNYWNPPGPSNSEAIRMRFDGVQARRLSDDLVFASFWIRFDTKMKFMPKPISTDARASAVFRKKPEGWRLITWAESPMSPILYVQKLYELRLRPDFPEFMDSVSKNRKESK